MFKHARPVRHISQQPASSAVAKEPKNSQSITLKHRRQLESCFLSALLAAFVVSLTVVATNAQENKQPLVLEPGKNIEPQISGGQVHKYIVRVAPNQYLRIVAEQKGSDIAMTLFDSKGGKLVDDYDYWSGVSGRETVALITKEADDCIIEIRAAKESQTGSCLLVLQDLRNPTDRDRIDAEADVNMRDGLKLFAKRTADDYAAAIKKLTTAAEQFHLSNNQIGEAQSLNMLGQSFNQIGEKQRFLESQEKALVIWRQLGDRKGEAHSLNAIGTYYLIQGNGPTAIDYFTKAKTIFELLEEKNSAGVALNNIAVIHNNSGEYQRALDHFQELLVLFRSLGRKREEAVMLNNIGNVFWVWGDRRTSFDYYQLALAVTRSIEDIRQEAQTLEFLGSNYYVLGDSTKALDVLHQALALQKQTGNQVGEAGVLSSLGLLHHRLGDAQKALGFLNQALAIFQKLNLRVGIAGTNYHLGVAYYGMGDLSKALAAFNTALELHRATHHKFNQADSLRMIAAIERDQGQFEASLAHASEAIELIEGLRQRINLPALRSSFFATMQDSFDVYIDALMQHERKSPGRYAAIALEGAERARARTLLDMLIESNADIKTGVDSQLIDRERALIRRLNSQATAFTRLLSGKYTEEQKAASAKELETLQREYEELQGKVRVQSPAYAALTQPKPATLKEIQQNILDGDTILLEYAFGTKRSYVFAITRDSFNTYELPERKKIDEAARRVYEAITARNKRVKFETVDEKGLRVRQADSDYVVASQALSDMVLKPVTAQLNKKRLLIVADGALQYVPLGALPDPTSAEKTAPILARRELITLPSASTLAVLRRSIAGRPPAPKLVAALADPVFDSNDERLVAKKRGAKEAQSAVASAHRGGEDASLSYLTRAVQDLGESADGLSLTRLPFTRNEANAIARFAPRSLRLVELDFDANRSVATSPELSQYRIVHFATHGILNSAHPNLSGLAFSLVDPAGQRQDGFVRASEIFNLKLPADLVVLSGCRTGLGKEIRGEGLVSLTRAFMYAGAARVMVSLWDVHDEATAELMKRFYQGLLGPDKLSPAAALRAAQVSMSNQKRWSSPYYWAAFTLQGEPR